MRGSPRRLPPIIISNKKGLSGSSDDYTKLTVSQARRPETIGSEVVLQGWVRTRRDSKAGFSFLELNDGSCLGNVQVVADGVAAELRVARSSGSRPGAA